MIPYKHRFGQRIKNDAEGSNLRAFLAHLHFTAAEAVAADTDGIVDGAAGTSGEGAEALVIVPADAAFIAQPPCARNLTVTVAATTAGDVAAGNIVIAGMNEKGEEISENFAVTADTPATITGTKAFKEITSITVPVQDGDSVTVDVGWGTKLGIGYKLAHNTVLAAYRNNAKEGTAPTVAVSADALESNTMALNSALNGSVVDAYLIVPTE
ncbi:MAG: hypothetical protein GX418_12145 [Clostridiales bacterium]|nr:hypothetical protein [Clostridiales bacterium]